MVRKSDEEREFRLRPRKPLVLKSGVKYQTPRLFRVVMHYARTSRNKGLGAAHGTSPTRTKAYKQRCAVRVTYSRNVVRGQWRAHGRYIARETSAHEADPRAVGFDAQRNGGDIATELNKWQRAGDERLWKLIISPEFGDRIDLRGLTRELLAGVQRDLGGGALEWVAVAHYNTEHPHIHVALRGADNHRRPISLERDYIKHGIRRIAEGLCTRQLGYRTELDAAEAERREVAQQRFTSLDRIIQRAATRMTQPNKTLDASRSGKSRMWVDLAMATSFENSTRSNG